MEEDFRAKDRLLHQAYVQEVLHPFELYVYEHPFLHDGDAYDEHPFLHRRLLVLLNVPCGHAMLWQPFSLVLVDGLVRDVHA